MNTSSTLGIWYTNSVTHAAESLNVMYGIRDMQIKVSDP